MKKLITICAVAVLMFAASNANALITVDFEGVPDTYYYYGGNQNLGTYYSGLEFGPDATVLDQVIYGYNSGGYPPHSGNAVIHSVANSTIRVDFDTPSTYVEAWYTSIDSFYLEAYDAGDTLLDSATGASNYGSNSLISVSGANIAYVLFHDAGSFYSIDDLGFTPIPAPGAILLGSIGVGLVGWLRRRRTL